VLGRDCSDAEDFLDAGLPSFYRLGRDGSEVRERLVATAYLSQTVLGRDYSDAVDFLDAGLPSYRRLGRDGCGS
jgi:hypothetical protein